MNVNKSDLESLKELIDGATSIVLVAHKSPDADTVGSALALKHSLIEKGYSNLFLLCQDEIPSSYSFLSGIDEFQAYINFVTGDVKLAICVDVASTNQLGNLLPAIENFQIVNIDHHQENTSFGNLNIVMPECSSAAEIVFRILQSLNFPINNDIATHLIAGIVYDTVGFSKTNTNASTLDVSSKLTALGGDLHLCMQNLLNMTTLNQLRFQAEALLKIQTAFRGKIIWTTIRNGSKIDVEDVIIESRRIASTMQEVKGIEIAAVFLQLNDREIKTSLRSVGNIDASFVASQMGGGGHRLAASYISKKKTLDKAVEEFLALLPPLLSESSSGQNQ